MNGRAARPKPSVALAHDYLTQRGGAERVVLALHTAFPEAVLHTALYLAGETYEGFDELDLACGFLNRSSLVRRRHRLGLPFMAACFSRMRVEADVVVCSSSGWAHGVKTEGHKVVYCHSPAKWLYRPESYLEHFGPSARAALRLGRGRLVAWDQAAMASADRIVVNSSITQAEVAQVYGRSSEVVAPASTLDSEGRQEALAGVEPGFVLCVSRLLGYKQLSLLLEVARELRDERFVVVGEGPLAASLSAASPPNITWAGAVDDERLRWAYANCRVLVSTSAEDFGLTPLEAAAYGRPSVVPRARGYLDHVIEERTGLFYDGTGSDLAVALRKSALHTWWPSEIRAHAEAFGADRFVERLRSIVEEMR